MKVLLLALILCLMIPATAYSQIAGLNNVSTITQTQTPVPTQCLDFNQDGICESIVLVNGTIKNPDLLPRSVSTDGSSSNLTTNVTAPMANANTTMQNATTTV